MRLCDVWNVEILFDPAKRGKVYLPPVPPCETDIQCQLLAIEIGMQNARLGTILDLKHFSKKTAVPAVIFIFVCIITALVIIEF